MTMPIHYGLLGRVFRKRSKSWSDKGKVAMGNPPKRKVGQGQGHRRFDGILLDVRSAAQWLGCSDKALRARVARRVIPFRRDGGRILFLRSELEKFAASLPGCHLEEAESNLRSRSSHDPQ